MKKLLWGLSIGAVILIIGAFLLGRFAFPNTLKDLPVPELSEGQRGEFPYIVNVTGLPEAVGGTYAGPTLFRQHSDGSYTANYAESMDIIEGLFPKDKVIFLMCGGGGYSGMMKNMLVKLGWDENKIYDVGGYWFYEGDNAVQVKRVLDNGEVVYDFYKVPYHEIEFEGLTEK